MLPRGHYGWVEKCVDQDPEAFMDRRDILPYNQAFIDLIDKENVFDLIVDIMGPKSFLVCPKQLSGVWRWFSWLYSYRWRRRPARDPRNRDKPTNSS